MGKKAAKSDQTSSINKNIDSIIDKKKPTKKLRKSNAANETDLSGDIDSLKNMKEKKNCGETDKKIKNLMSELLSLVGGSLKEETNGSDKEIEKSVSLNSEISIENSEKVKKIYENSIMEDSSSTLYKESENIEDRNSPEILTSSGPSPVSKWLNTNIDYNTPESRQNKSKKFLNSFNHKNYETSTEFKKFTSHKETDKLLYKSFVLQNLQKYLSSSEESVCELGISSTNTSNKNKGKTIKRTNKKNATQRKTNKKISGQRGRKRRIEPECDVEVIYSKLNSLSCSARNNTPDVEVGIECLDWDEPFFLDDTTDKCSFDVEIFEPVNEKTNVPKRKKSIKSQEPNVQSNISRTSESGSGTNEKNWECPICFEPSFGQEIVTTLCGHVFCKNCIEKYNSSKGRTCPSCRTDLTNKPLITLFNL